MPTSLTDAAVAPIERTLGYAHRAFARRFPGESADRQPVHTVYGGAHLFRADIVDRLGSAAMTALETWAPDARTLAEAAGLDRAVADRVYDRVGDKLRREPVEDFRIDFEDGYGIRGDDEEDACAEQVAAHLADAHAAGGLPPFVGIRIKPFSEELKHRAIRTMDLVVTTMLRRTGGVLPENFVITLPKVQVPAEVTALADLLDTLEAGHGLPARALRVELMLETTQSVFGPDGYVSLPLIVNAARGRCRGVHFGVYDYTASCAVTARHQQMTHPACDFARHVMQVALAGTGVWMSDGATNVMPVGDDRAAVHRAWRQHADDVRHSLRHGFYQGWDLHPAQLPTRYAAVYGFFLEGLEAASRRLGNFVEQAARATLAGNVFDDAATGQGLLNFFLRGINCGAITEDEAAAAGLSVDELRSRSFARILAGRA